MFTILMFTVYNGLQTNKISDILNFTPEIGTLKKTKKTKKCFSRKNFTLWSLVRTTRKQTKVIGKNLNRFPGMMFDILSLLEEPLHPEPDGDLPQWCTELRSRDNSGRQFVLW